MADTPRLVLGHGASGAAASMEPYVSGLARRGVTSLAIELPRRGRSVVPAEQAIDAFAEAVAPGDAIGGHSYGGRVASLLAAGIGEPGKPSDSIRALVLFSYPLHPPGKPEAWDARTSHWPAITCPVLVLMGGSDPFARPELLPRAMERLVAGELVVYPAGRHGLHRSHEFEAALDRTADFLRGLAAP